MRYSVDVQACAGILRDVSVQSAGFEPAITGLSVGAQNAAEASRSGLVSGAIQGFFEKSLSGDIESAVSLVSKALEETGNALTYVNVGDEEMAATSVASLQTTDGSTAEVTSWGGGAAGRPRAV